MATVKQIKATNNTTFDIACDWSNIDNLPYNFENLDEDRINATTLHLGGDSNFGGKIVFGDANNDNVEVHDDHYACIEEIDDDVLNFKATHFIFEVDSENGGVGLTVTGGPIIVDNEYPIECNITGKSETAGYADTADTANTAGYADTAGAADTAGTANCLADKSKGSATNPVYINASGRPVACTYSLSKSVPSNAVFTDANVTNNTTTSTYYLCGSKASANTTGTLVKRSDVYIDTSGHLNAKGLNVHASAKIESDASYNIYVDINGEAPLVIANDNNSNKFVAPGSAYNNKYSLGTSTRLWKTVYASKFIGKLEGNASTATTATVATNATNDGNGDRIDTTYLKSSTFDEFTEYTDSTYLKLSGGTMTDSIITPANDSTGIYPATNNYGFVGSSTNKFYKMYATTFYGALSGNATTATTATNATNVKSNITTSTYYLCGTTNSTTNTSGTLVKRSTVYVDTSGYLNVTGHIYAKSGIVYASNGFYETSDERLKDFSNKIDVDLDKISKIKKHRFTWKGSENKNEEIGVSAQEIKELYPEIVSENENGYLSVAYDKLSVIALAAVDKLHQENIELKERIVALENKLK